ncbi:MAG: hypothetical protein WAK82_43350 [Streptosporangiaceae bacterium]
MLVGPPDRAVEAARVLAPEHDEPPRMQVGGQPVARRAASVQVDSQIRGFPGPGHGLQLAGGQQLVDRPGQRHQRRERRRGGEHDPVAGKGAADRPVGGHPGQEVAQAEGSQQQDARRHGQSSSARAACSRVVDRPLR